MGKVNSRVLSLLIEFPSSPNISLSSLIFSWNSWALSIASLFSRTQWSTASNTLSKPVDISAQNRCSPGSLPSITLTSNFSVTASSISQRGGKDTMT